MSPRKRKNSPIGSPLPIHGQQILDAIYAAFPHFGPITTFSEPPVKNYLRANLHTDNFRQRDEVVAFLESQGWTVIERYLGSRFNHHLSVLFPDCKLAQSDTVISVRVVAHVSYDDRELAKSRGYWWEPSVAEWWKLVEGDNIDAHLASLPFSYSLSHKVYSSYEVIFDAALPKVQQPGAVAGRMLAAMRQTHGGPPKVLRACPHCLEKFGTAQLRSHKPRCTSNPLVVKRETHKTAQQSHTPGITPL